MKQLGSLWIETRELNYCPSLRFMNQCYSSYLVQDQQACPWVAIYGWKIREGKNCTSLRFMNQCYSSLLVQTQQVCSGRPRVHTFFYEMDF